MEESRKKLIMVSVITMCIGLAAAITYKTRHGRGGTIDDIPEGEITWVRCANKDCGAEYQMGKKEYFKEIQEHLDPMVTTSPPLICRKCGEPSVYRAEKCEKCGQVFFRGSVPNDFADRCPECGYSKTEASRRQRTEGR